MPYYSYKAVNEQGGIQEDIIEAADEFECMRVLRDMGLQPLNIQKKSTFFVKKPEESDDLYLGKPIPDKTEHHKKIIKAAIRRKIKFSKTIHYDDFVIFLREFAALISAGINIFPAIELLAEHSADVSLRKALTQVLQNLQQGQPIHIAFSKDVKIFPKVFISMLQAGIISGNMPKILNDMADYYEKEQKVRKKFISTLTYPVSIFIAALAGMFFLVNYIFPDFVRIFRQLNLQVPLPTKILMLMVDLFKQPITIFSMIAVAVALTVIIISYLSTPFGQYQFDWFKVKMPYSGNIIKKIMLCRFSRTLGTLYENGINLSYALDITCDVIDNKYYQEEIKKVKDEILHTGSQMHKVVAEHKKIFPNVFAHFLSIGEETGYLGEMLKKIAHYLEVEVFFLFDNFIVIIEPVMIFVLGSLVLFIMLSLFLPIYNLVNQFNF